MNTYNTCYVIIASIFRWTTFDELLMVLKNLEYTGIVNNFNEY